MSTQLQPLYRRLASVIEARLNCQASGNVEWEGRHSETIARLVENLPSGSGWDDGTHIELSSSHTNKIVLYGEYHHMDDGMYDGWTKHTITVTPNLVNGFSLRISGPNRGDIKEYLYQLFDEALRENDND